MSKLPALKLYRKLLILAVMSVGLFFLSSINRVDANPCCNACLATLGSCNDYCHGLSSDPATEECLANCATDYHNCSRACGGGLPVCP